MSGIAPIAKLAVNIITVAGVSKVIGDVIKNNVNVETTADAVKIWTGTFVIGAMVAEVASKHLNNQMDLVSNWYQGRKTETNEEPAIVSE